MESDGSRGSKGGKCRRDDETTAVVLGRVAARRLDDSRCFAYEIQIDAPLGYISSLYTLSRDSNAMRYSFDGRGDEKEFSSRRLRSKSSPPMSKIEAVASRLSRLRRGSGVCISDFGWSNVDN